LALGALVALAVLGTNFPWSALLSQHSQLSAAAAQLHTLTGENRLLTEQEQQLNSKAEIDRLARQDYQMVLPGQSLYDVLPPTGVSSSNPNSPLTGDPGNQPLVAPANAPDMTPDPGLAQVSTATAQSAAAGNVGTAPSGSGGSGGSGAASGRPTGAPRPSSFWSRVSTTLEFWK
jgi:Septum formation initiator